MMFTRFRPMSAAAMTAVLGCALVATAVPAEAKGKKKEEETQKGSAIPVSGGFGPFVKKMGAATNAKDAAALQAAITEGQGSATTDGDRYWLAFYQLQLGILNKDQTTQSQALDAMIDSGLTPPENAAVYNFFSGNFAYGAKDYAKAVKRLEAAKAAGSTEAALPVLLMDSYLESGQLDQGVAIAKAAITASRAAGQRPPEDLYVRPARALQTAKRTSDLLDILTMRVQDYGTPAIWRNTLYIMLQQSDTDKDMNLDILRLMRAAGAMTDRPEYMEYAALATEAGYPGEVVAVVKQGQDLGVVSKSDERFNTVLESQEPRAKADAPSLTADAAKPATLANPKLARQTADGLVGIGDYAKAITLYQAAAASDPLAQYRLGVAQALAGQSDAALASFAKVQGPRQRLAELWSIHVKEKAAPAAVPAAAPAAAPATGN